MNSYILITYEKENDRWHKTGERYVFTDDTKDFVEYEFGNEGLPEHVFTEDEDYIEYEFLDLAFVFEKLEYETTEDKQEYLREHFNDEDNFYLEGVDYSTGTREGIDRDQVADGWDDGYPQKIIMYYDEYILTNIKTEGERRFTKEDMLDFVKTW